MVRVSPDRTLFLGRKHGRTLRCAPTRPTTTFPPC